MAQLAVGCETDHLWSPLPDLLTVTLWEATLVMPGLASTLSEVGLTDSDWADATTGRIKRAATQTNRRMVVERMFITELRMGMSDGDIEQRSSEHPGFFTDALTHSLWSPDARRHVNTSHPVASVFYALRD